MNLIELHSSDVEIPMILGAPSSEVPVQWSHDAALRVDLAILEQVEAMEDRVANASMQVKVSTQHLWGNGLGVGKE